MRQVAATCIVALAYALSGPVASADEMTIVDPAGAGYAMHVTSLKEARFKRTVKQQFDFSCGSAAVATLLTYQYDYPMTEQTAFAQMWENGNQEKIRQQGFSLLDIRRFLDAHGFVADGFELPLQTLTKTHTPAIVLITEHGYHHFVVVKGLRDGRVLVGDPATGTRPMSLASFEQKWEDHVIFVIHNRPERAVFNDPRDWRVAPSAPLYTGIAHDGLYNVVMPKHGPSDF
ncbi:MULTISPECIES: C39 family peptidase [Burkholderia]|uniref:Peptidase C39 n=1 Tax=Burkholderia contaminans TaxID=488447 RepID=A0A2S5E3R2_9BURK|nr:MULTISPECIES: C39 family peptidase [Burkholderia]EKS9798704.1 C39 family peptidase [Burkholderia cepacia]EKS9803204.1 C39 family peptidase [Burkholderia cepacia]EKS9810688.1 C39 family peptidase [Burkholderia cepacia]EKS9819581.1 C39 family peptidase [Burkholderia cepacia]EKS9827199.1 C39 family peptidase [Burkholderia cepacia]